MKYLLSIFFNVIFTIIAISQTSESKDSIIIKFDSSLCNMNAHSFFSHKVNKVKENASYSYSIHKKKNYSEVYIDEYLEKNNIARDSVSCIKGSFRFEHLIMREESFINKEKFKRYIQLKVIKSNSSFLLGKTVLDSDFFMNNSYNKIFDYFQKKSKESIFYIYDRREITNDTLIFRQVYFMTY